jgi:hypothetical protein
MINLTNYTEVRYQPSKRATRCKNCDSMFGERAVDWENGDLIEAGGERYVLVGWGPHGPGTLHVTFCRECLESQRQILTHLVSQIEKATKQMVRETNLVGRA